jgi:hypothetical protein
LAAGQPNEMVCLFHGDYGPSDPAFAHFALSGAGHSWNVEPRLLKQARNIGEAEAIERHVLRGESVSWCRSGYGWVEQDAITWFYVAALVLVVLPYVAIKLKAWASARPFRASRSPNHS